MVGYVKSYLVELSLRLLANFPSTLMVPHSSKLVFMMLMYLSWNLDIFLFLILFLKYTINWLLLLLYNLLEELMVDIRSLLKVRDFLRVLNRQKLCYAELKPKFFPYQTPKQKY